jgi:hypothetical protein
MFRAKEFCLCLFWCVLASGADLYEFIPVYETHRPPVPSNWNGCSQLLLLTGNTEGLEKYPAAAINDPGTSYSWSVRVKQVEPLNGPDGIRRKILIVSGKPTIEVMQSVIGGGSIAERVQIVYESKVQRSPSRLPLMHVPVIGTGYLAAILLGYSATFVPSILLVNKVFGSLFNENALPHIAFLGGGVVGLVTTIASVYIAEEADERREYQCAAFTLNPAFYTYRWCGIRCYAYWLEFEKKALLKRTLSSFKEGLSLLASATEDSTLIVFQGHEDYRTTSFNPFRTPWEEAFLRTGLREK